MAYAIPDSYLFLVEHMPAHVQMDKEKHTQSSQNFMVRI